MQFVEQAKHRPPNTTKTKSDNLETDINCSLMAQTKPLKCVPIRNRDPYALSSLLRCKRSMVSILPPAEMAIFGLSIVKRMENDGNIYLTHSFRNLNEIDVRKKIKHPGKNRQREPFAYYILRI